MPVEESVITLDNLHGQTIDQFKAYVNKSATRWCGFTLVGARTCCNLTMQVLGHSERVRLAITWTYGWGTGIIWNDGRATP